MSSIQILGGDWEILFDDEFTSGTTGLKMIRNAVASPTIISTNALYSAVADAMDDLGAMDDENPMLPTTPEAYTMENGYFITREATEFLQGGAISSNGWGSGVIRSIIHNNTGTPPDSDDIGRQITQTDTGDTGCLLDFETLPDGTFIIWIRPDDPATDLFDDVDSVLTTDGGMSVTGVGASSTGESLYSNIQVIGGVATNSEVYIVQDRVKLGSFDDVNRQFYTTNTGAATGIIDVLIRVQLGGTSIAAGILEVFNRRYTALYDNFALDVSGGGRSALPLATADDINNTTGYRTALWDAGTGSAMSVGDLVTNTFAGKEGALAVVTDVTDSGATGTFDYYLTGTLADFSDNDTFTGVRNGTIMGAPTAATGGPTDVGINQGGTVTIAFGTTTVDHNGDGTPEPYSITIDCIAANPVPIANVYERIKYVTRRGATAADLFSTPTSEAGETFRGLQLQAQYDGASGVFDEGEDVTNETAATGVQAGIALAVNTTNTYITLTDTSGAFADNDQLQDEDTSTVDIMGAPTVITPVKSSPFGTYTGSQIFGSRGVVYINPASADVQDYILVDDNGVLRIPPNTVSVVVSGLVAGDVVFVAPDTGTAGVIDKDRFSGLAAGNNIGDADVVCVASIDTDVPSSGVLRIVETTLQVEHRYYYESFAAATFTLIDPDENGNAPTASGSSTQLDDSTASFTTGTDQPQVGMLIRNTVDGSTAVITSVDSAIQITHTALTGGTSNDWQVGTDFYEINNLIQNYAGSDNIYVPIIDQVSTATTASNTLVYDTDIGVVANVRLGGTILPFTTNSIVEATGVTIAAIRTLDTIAT